jgi:hypothetical protein
MGEKKYTAEYVAATIIAEIKTDEVLMACKNFVELHEHCDANMLGCSEELLEAVGTERALVILNAAQNEVNLWLIVI